MSYKLDPCTACKKQYPIDDINNINSCCYNTLGAFRNESSINSFRDLPATEICRQCVSESVKALGRDPCEFRPEPSPIWVQVPHYFPIILQDGDKDMTPTIALDKCFSLCETSNYSHECKLNCKIDHDAVHVVENYLHPISKYTSNTLTLGFVFITIIIWLAFNKLT